MFYNVVAELPTFAENKDNKEKIVKELMQENDVENAAGGIIPNNPVQAPDKNLNVDGEQKPAIQLNKKKKGCGC